MGVCLSVVETGQAHKRSGGKHRDSEENNLFDVGHVDTQGPLQDAQE